MLYDLLDEGALVYLNDILSTKKANKNTNSY